jgi:sortase A
VISGHRDTHFRFLRELRPGDRLQLSGRGGSRWYAVGDLEVVDSSRLELVIDPGLERLSLVTCYPFDAPLAGGPLRYVVTAYPTGS